MGLPGRVDRSNKPWGRPRQPGSAPFGRWAQVNQELQKTVAMGNFGGRFAKLHTCMSVRRARVDQKMSSACHFSRSTYLAPPLGLLVGSVRRPQVSRRPEQTSGESRADLRCDQLFMLPEASGALRPLRAQPSAVVRHVFNEGRPELRPRGQRSAPEGIERRSRRLAGDLIALEDLARARRPASKLCAERGIPPERQRQRGRGKGNTAATALAIDASPRGAVLPGSRP